jgi:hypothetical protein
MKVFRIEHKRNRAHESVLIFAGPYRMDVVDLWCKRNHTSTTHPTFFDDLGKKSPRDILQYFAGFKSLTQLENWFNKAERKRLKKLGFVIAQYDCQKAIQGKKQVVFQPKGKRVVFDILAPAI